MHDQPLAQMSFKQLWNKKEYDKSASRARRVRNKDDEEAKGKQKQHELKYRSTPRGIAQQQDAWARRKLQMQTLAQLDPAAHQAKKDERTRKRKERAASAN